MTPLQEKFTRALDLIEQWPDKLVVAWCTATLIRDQGPRVGVPPTAALLRSIPTLSPDQQGHAGWLMNDALAIMRGPNDERTTR